MSKAHPDVQIQYIDYDWRLNDQKVEYHVEEVMTLRSGDIAPDFILTTVEGQIVSLSRMLRTVRSVLLVFLRHLG